MPYHVYVSTGDHLSRFILDETTGELAAQGQIDLGGGLAP